MRLSLAQVPEERRIYRTKPQSSSKRRPFHSTIECRRGEALCEMEIGYEVYLRRLSRQYFVPSLRHKSLPYDKLVSGSFSALGKMLDESLAAEAPKV